MKKPKYSYIIASMHGQRFIVITDEDDGKVNLPQGMNSVLAEILVNDTRITELPGWNVIYDDSNGTWHSFNVYTAQTAELSKSTHTEAMELYVKLMNTREKSTCKSGRCRRLPLLSPAADTYIHDSKFL